MGAFAVCGALARPRLSLMIDCGLGAVVVILTYELFCSLMLSQKTEMDNDDGGGGNFGLGQNRYSIKTASEPEIPIFIWPDLI